MNKIAHIVIVHLLSRVILAQDFAEIGSFSCTHPYNNKYETIECLPIDGENKKYYAFDETVNYRDTDHYRISINVNHEATLLINKFDYFVRYRDKLVFLYIELGSPTQLDPISQTLRSNLNLLREKLFFSLPLLRELSIKNINFNSRNHIWYLPSGLRYLVFQGTRYTEYNLTNLRYLRRIDFTNNHLTKLPDLYYPLYSLEELYLANNPLNEVTTNDIAKLCMLTKLNLDGTSFMQPGRFCECERLRLFIDKLTDWMKTEHYARFVLVNPLKCNNAEKTSCTPAELDLSEAIQQREHCLRGISQDTNSTDGTSTTTNITDQPTSVTASTNTPGPEISTSPNHPTSSVVSGPTPSQNYFFVIAIMISLGACNKFSYSRSFSL